jgi:hypothetical protein
MYMDKPAKILTILGIFLVICVLVTGCTNNSGSNSAATATTASIPSTTAGPLYTAGDIVGSSSNPSSAWLIISYDSSTDAYTRAFIYKNTDGTWGYRINSNTESYPRSALEKVYKVKITHVTVSSIPTTAPTVVATPVVITTKTTSATVVVTTTSAGKPQFTSMIPSDGDAGSSVSVTDLLGSNFQSGATVQLTHTGSTSINATSVAVGSASHLACTFTIPSDAVAGTWDVVITNPDGQSVTYANYFNVHGSSSTATTTTTTGASSGTVSITSVTVSPPAIGMINGWIGTLTIDTSTPLTPGPALTVTLSNSAGQTFTATNPQVSSSGTEITPFFNQPVPQGTWDIRITNPDGSYGVKTGGFVIS